ncbi:MAG TPA: helix-turn-helix domain-containing protein [Thermoanaerobaculia bacterium]|nr:helix-turn-helix domain-containing protein [Thermoanaerobaculia bacterium]
MKIAYDEKNRGLLITLGDATHYLESREVVPGVVIDFDKKGKPLAIEIEDVEGLIDADEIKALLQPRIENGADLRKLRDRLGLTQEQLGRLIDIPRNTIARWEREELPIEKVVQLELALKTITRPSVKARLEIVFSDDEGEGALECGFCGQRYGLPFGMQLRGDITDPPATDVIYEHYDPGIDNDQIESIPRCPNWHRWKATRWQVRSSDSGMVVARGSVRVLRRGDIQVTVSFPTVKTPAA